MNRNILYICILSLFFVALPSNAQNRMKNTKSTSDLLRETNPDSINSVGKIEGNEVDRNPEPQRPQRKIEEVPPEPTLTSDEEDEVDDEFLPDEEKSNKGIEKFD
jgi:hypothetical protein